MRKLGDMSGTSDGPPNQSGNIFNRSQVVKRTPPSTNKRTLGQITPTQESPINKRQQLDLSNSDLENTFSHSPTAGASDLENANYYELVHKASSYLSTINEIINDQGSRINIANKTSIMDLTQRVTGIVSLLAIKSCTMETKLANTERELGVATRKIDNCPDKPNFRNPTYAETLNLKLPPKTAPKINQVRPPLPCVIAYPSTPRKDELTTSSATKNALMKAIQPSDGFQIVGVKKAAKSGVVLRVANEHQLNKINSMGSMEAIKKAGLRLEKPKGRNPRILVKDIPGSMEDLQFLKALFNQNIKDEISVTELDFIKSTRIVRRRTLELYNKKWLGLEVTPQIRNHLMTTKEKLYIDWTTCRFIDDLEVVRCVKCQQFGHVAKYCTDEFSCSFCAEKHDSKSCPRKDNPNFKPVCASCKRFKKPTDHVTGSADCPTFQFKLNQLLLHTNFK